MSDDDKEPVPPVKTRPTEHPSGVPGWHATFEMHAISWLDELDHGDLSRPRRRAAETALRHAGLRAAVRFKADIEPYLRIGDHISSSGTNVGVVAMMDHMIGQKRITIDWGTGEQTAMSFEDLARRLRDGGWSFPGG